MAWYKNPVMITEGKMQYLFDETGRRYLDVSQPSLQLHVYMCLISYPVFQLGHTPVACDCTFVNGQIFAQASQIKHIWLANTAVAVVAPKATTVTAKFMLCALGGIAPNCVSLNEGNTQQYSVWLFKQLIHLFLCSAHWLFVPLAACMLMPQTNPGCELS